MLCARNRPCLTPRGSHTAVCEAASLTPFPDGKLGSEAVLHVQGTWLRAPGTPLPSPPGEGSHSGRQGQKYEIPGSADATPGRCPLRLSNGALASLYTGSPLQVNSDFFQLMFFWAANSTSACKTSPGG